MGLAGQFGLLWEVVFIEARRADGVSSKPDILLTCWHGCLGSKYAWGMGKLRGVWPPAIAVAGGVRDVCCFAEADILLVDRCVL